MPDMPLSQVPAAPATAKASRGAEPAATTAKDSSSNQGFSTVLGERLQSGGGGTAAPDKAGRAGGGEQAIATADGKTQPPGGNAVTAVIAALDADVDLEPVAAVAGETAVDETADAALAPAMLLPLGTPTTQAPETAGDVWGRVQHPGNPASGVAQAVQDSLPGAGDAATDALADAPGAEFRMLTQSQPGGPGAYLTGPDVSHDRTSASPALPAMATSPTHGAPQEVVARPPLPVTAIDVPLRQPGWDQALSDRVVWVVNQKFQGAEIKLNPPQLGPIEVRIQMHHDQAQVSFTAQHGAARDALEAALPRLREMFAANGLGLGDVNVSQHSFAEQQRQLYDSGGGRFRSVAGDDDEIDTPLQQGIAHTGLISRGGIDLFA